MSDSTSESPSAIFQDLLDAAECAARVLFLLEREVDALGFRAGNVRERLRAAIAKAGGDDGRWKERVEEARSDLSDAAAELRGEVR